MAIVAVFDFSDYGIEKYDEVLGFAGPVVWQQPARSHHVCFQGPEGWGVVDVWDDEASFAAFGERVIGPALAAAGIDAPPPKIHRVHNEHDRRDGSADNVATVTALYEAFGRGDIPAILDQVAEDVEWEEGADASHGIPWLQPGRGKAHVAAFFESLGQLEIKHFQPAHILGQRDVVVAVIDIELVVTATGKGFADRETHLWRFGADGTVAGFRHITDTAQMAAAMQA